MTENAKTHPFQAEVTQVLKLVIGSLYSNREIFLRELISNASDALDKLRFEAITQPGLSEGASAPRVRVIPDAEAGTLTIWDNGIGMSEEALIDQLGTIAKSGSKAFVEKLEAAKQSDVQLIGQFGVGFYSGYLVADRIEVVSRAAGATSAYRWTSDGQSSFTVDTAERDSVGTSIVLHLKEDAKQFLDEYQLRHLIGKYSDYLAYPIELSVKKAEGEPSFETINRGTALWQRSPSEVEDAQYEEFYKHLTGDWEKPLAHQHFKIEGTQLFSGLLFTPGRAPFDLFSPESRHGVRLHVKRVFIMDDCAELLPKWLRFIRGVVDSDDLPLNVSREILQDSKSVQVIRKQVIRQVFDMLDKLSEDTEAYSTFWTNFGAVLKEGLHFDGLKYQDRFTKLVRFQSTKGEGLVSLADYKARMPEGQKAIYYLAGDSRSAVERSPHLEALKKRGYEVLLMTDPVDSFAVDGIGTFDDLPLVSASAADLKLEASDSDEESSKDDDALSSLLSFFRIRLQDQVSEVRVSHRLTDSPVCLVIPDGGVAPHIERLLRVAQGDVIPQQKRILEVNPDHTVIRALDALHESDAEDAQVSEWIDVLYRQALLAEGSPIDDPATFAAQVTRLMEIAATQRAEQISTGAES